MSVLVSRVCVPSLRIFFFFFNDTATTEIYTLSLHDALPISHRRPDRPRDVGGAPAARGVRSEEHTSELQSHSDLVCRLLLEKKNMIVFHLPFKSPMFLTLSRPPLVLFL